jgi:RecA-family ATPase
MSEPLELPEEIVESIASWRRTVDNARPDLAPDILRNAAADLFRTRKVSKTIWADSHAVIGQVITDSLADMADRIGLNPDKAQAIFVQGHCDSEETASASEKASGHAAHHTLKQLPPLKLADWLARDLPAPDFIMGNRLSTTCRALLVARTGLGKTNFGLSLGLHISAGAEFLHWRGRRPSTVLYIDGEMARRLLRQRMEDAIARLGASPERFHALSHEDVEGFAPLNTPAGQAYIDGLIADIGPVDLIVFDSIMCLLQAT